MSVLPDYQWVGVDLPVVAVQEMVRYRYLSVYLLAVFILPKQYRQIPMQVEGENRPGTGEYALVFVPDEIWPNVNGYGLTYFQDYL